ncbi:MAG: general secretion pathway protein GspB [Moritella sp.]|uniref:general secretion pathway protein GspB n=1 Tax=Moritella sp. TaxID=78556 RepID=UPI0029A77AFD|nr:general secretion pathway protein GspB [Moritella sp.]MDX2318978.1 general secretion pathway protein GspB [Moritella sp.]
MKGSTGKTLNKLSVTMSLIASVLWTPTLLANTTTAISSGIEQTDALIILKLPAIKFEHPLSLVRIPEAQVTPSSATADARTIVIPTAPATAKVNSPAELLSMNDELEREQVSPDLLAKFNRALTATSDADSVPVKEVEESYNAVPIEDLPAHLRAQIPDISYSSHVYSSKSKSRSVRLNNRDLREGSWLSNDVEILEILQNEVIMRVGAQSFSLKALADWSA